MRRSNVIPEQCTLLPIAKEPIGKWRKPEQRFKSPMLRWYGHHMAYGQRGIQCYHICARARVKARSPVALLMNVLSGQMCRYSGVIPYARYVLKSISRGYCTGQLILEKPMSPTEVRLCPQSREYKRVQNTNAGFWVLTRSWSLNISHSWLFSEGSLRYGFVEETPPPPPTPLNIDPLPPPLDPHPSLLSR